MRKLLILMLSLIGLVGLQCKESGDDLFFLLAAANSLSGSSTGGNQGTPAQETVADAPDVAPEIQANLDLQPSTQDGTSTSSDIVVENGVIVGNLDQGSLTTGDGTEILVVEDGELTGNIVVTNGSQGNAGVDGQVQVIGDDFTFTPDDTLDPGDVYNVAVTDGDGNTHNETVFLAVDNTCNTGSLFAQVEVLGGENTTFTISDKVFTDNNGLHKMLIGWDFDTGNFKFLITNKTPGHKYVLTAYGVYNIPGHTCEVYYQRWTGSNAAVADVNITGMGSISVDPSDKSIPNIDGGYHNFAKTYIQVNVLDANGVDVTETETAKVRIIHVQNNAFHKSSETERRIADLSGNKRVKSRKIDGSALAAYSANQTSTLVFLNTAVIGMLALLGFYYLHRKRQRLLKDD